MNESKAKRIGQFFTPEPIASLLAQLVLRCSTKENSLRVIDPMAGEGALLAPFRHANVGEALCGIDIDPDTFGKLESNCTPEMAFCKNAFECSEPFILSPKGWDVVVTNPPYIRYQLQKGNLSVANALKHIKKLIEIKEMSPEEKRVYLQCVSSVSGQADFAIPCLILCTLHVAMNGIVGLVVPTTWLSRDYSAPLQYLFGKLFQIKCIVHDEGSNWFEQAEVKTCLVIAKRVACRDISGLDWTKCRYVLTGKNHLNPDSFVKEDLARKLLAPIAFAEANTCIQDIPESSLYVKLRLLSNDESFPADERIAIKQLSAYPPQFHFALSGIDVLATDNGSLSEKVFQGLRTGANDFFVLPIKKRHKNFYQTCTNAWDGGKELVLPKKLCIPLIHYAFPNVLFYDESILNEVVLLLGNASLTDQIQAYIKRAQEYTFKKGERDIHFYEMSAVKTNISSSDSKKKWYMLPPLKPRHCPDLFIPRVIGDRVWCGFVDQQEDHAIAVDANFITVAGYDTQKTKAFFGLLNSSWFDFCCEAFGTVMGGGALKIESSMIKQIPLPVLTPDHQETLCSTFDKCRAGEITQSMMLREFDETIFDALGLRKDDERTRFYMVLKQMKEDRKND